MNSELPKRPKNGVTVRVWEIADELYQRHGRIPPCKEVVKLYVKEGGHQGTGSKQFYDWKKVKEQLEVLNASTTNRGLKNTVQLRVEANGRILVPAEYRDAMELDKTGRVSACIMDGELHLISPKTALRKAQKIAKKFKKPGQNIVDEFLSERKSMWGE